MCFQMSHLPITNYAATMLRVSFLDGNYEDFFFFFFDKKMCNQSNNRLKGGMNDCWLTVAVLSKQLVLANQR